MSDEPTTPVEPTPAEPAPAATPAATFTQADVDAAVKARVAREQRKSEAALAEMQAKLEKAQAKPKPKAQPKEEPSPDLVEIKQELADLRAERAQQAADRAFLKQVGERQLDPETAELLRLKFNPEDPGAIESLIEKYASKPAAPSYNSPGAPSAVGPEPVTNPVHWDADTVARLKSQGKLRAEFEKYFANQGRPGIFGASRKG